MKEVTYMSEGNENNESEESGSDYLNEDEGNRMSNPSVSMDNEGSIC